MKRDQIFLLVALLLILLSGIWFFFFRTALPPKTAENSPEAASSEAVLSATAVVPPAPAKQASPEAAAAATASAGGSEAVSAIITSPDLGDNVIVAKLLELLPKLDEAAQAEAAEHIANLSTDEEAVKWSQNVIAWNLPAPAAEVLYQSLNNRPHEVNYPVLGAIADNPQHPKNKETLETLSVISDPPPDGTTWAQWLQGKLREEAAQANP